MVQKSYFEGVAAGRAKVDGDEDLSMEESWIGNPVRIRVWFFRGGKTKAIEGVSTLQLGVISGVLQLFLWTKIQKSG